jgi:hypothetical protein
MYFVADDADKAQPKSIREIRVIRDEKCFTQPLARVVFFIPNRNLRNAKLLLVGYILVYYTRD